MEYAAKFNELSHFAPNQVATEEVTIDHFEQGLKGPIKRMIAGMFLLVSKKCIRGQ